MNDTVKFNSYPNNMNDTVKFNSYPKNFPLPLLLDGSTGVLLMRYGMKAGESPEKFVLDNPDILIKLQNTYVSSGSDAVFAATFGCNRPTLQRDGFVNADAAEIASRLAAISKKTNAKLIGGDMGPTGLFIEPFGDSTFDEIIDIYAEQAQGLESAGVDFFITETNISLYETKAAVLGVKKVSDKPIFATLSLDKNGRTLSGDTLLASFLTLAEAGVNAFGANCSTGPDVIYELLKQIVPYSFKLGIPLIAKPNAGLPVQHEDGTQSYDADWTVFEKYAEKFLKSGIYILGGCCGTDDRYIAAIRTVIDTAVIDTAVIDTTPIAVNDCADPRELVCTNKAVCAKKDAQVVTIDDMESAREFISDSFFADEPVTVKADGDILNYIKKYYNGKVI
jgi:5-methyltetrahydrofolate--homocysteine methyltransferase